MDLAIALGGSWAGEATTRSGVGSELGANRPCRLPCATRRSSFDKRRPFQLLLQGTLHKEFPHRLDVPNSTAYHRRSLRSGNMQEPKTGLRRGKFFPAVGPTGASDLQVLVPNHRLRFVVKQGIGAIYETAKIVPLVLARPTMIYEGIRYDEDDERFSGNDGWLCYSAAPGRSFHYGTGNPIQRRGEVLLVFVNSDRVAYNWRWEDEDPEKPGTPLEVEGRFARELL